MRQAAGKDGPWTNLKDAWIATVNRRARSLPPCGLGSGVLSDRPLLFTRASPRRVSYILSTAPTFSLSVFSVSTVSTVVQYLGLRRRSKCST